MKSLTTSVLLLLALLLTTTAAANPITPQQAQQNALTFLKSKAKSINNSSLRQASLRSSSAANEGYYVFNIGNNAGYVIASGDDCAPAILGYADSGHIDMDSLPENMKSWLEEYARQIQFMREKGCSSSRQPVSSSNLALISPLLTSAWGQDDPYNKNCPDFFGYDKCLTGCVATAMAQVMYYHRSNSVTQTTATIPAYTCSRTWDFGYGPQRISVDAIPAGAYIDWDAMMDSYNGTESARKKQAVANLMKYCGASVQMDYADRYNGGSTAPSLSVPVALSSYFNYNNGMSLENRNSYSSNDEWNILIYNELRLSRPVYYSGFNDSYGHAFVCDGYGGAGYFHINWGWNGSYDGYFLLTALDPEGGSSGYNLRQEALINAFPRSSTPIPSPIISFADANVKALCVQYWDFDGDGQLSQAEAALVSTLGEVFSNNRDITSFNELKYFTGLTRIGTSAFMGCRGLTSVTIPNSVTTIGDGAFYYCDALINIELPNSVTSIGREAFGNTAWFNNQPDGVVYVGQIAYKYKGEMPEETSISLKNGTTGIAGYAFENCRNLTSVSIPNSVTTIGRYAFYVCSGLTSVTIPNSVISISDGVFCACRSLPSVSIPNSVTSIGRAAFENCIALTSVSIPSSVTSIGREAFENCSALMSVSIPNSVTSIDIGAFRNCSGLTSVTIPNSVTYISRAMFYGCSDLTSVSIPYSVTSIEDYAFYGCSNLASLSIPNSVTSIGNYAFQNCCTLVPYSVRSIGHEAFFGCSGLMSIVVNSYNPKYDSRNACNAIIETSSNTLILGCQNTVIPNSVTAIAYEAFALCTGLTSVIIPNSVTSIGSNAFYGCTGLTSMIIPNSVTSVGQGAFAGCTGLTSVSIGNSVTSIGNRAFDNCSGLTKVSIPNSVISIGDAAFYRCSGLTKVTIPNSVTSIGYLAFYGCTSLTSVIIPNSVTSFGYGAFYDCNGMTDVYSCITDLSKVKSGDWMFVVYGEGGNYDYSGRTLHVPHGTVDAYQVDENWYPYFGSIVEILPGDVNCDVEVNIADVNTAIDIILGGTADTTFADVNGDGEINIADINTLIDIILTH